MNFWSEESKNPVMMNKILDSLKIPANCSGVCVSILHVVVEKTRKIMLFHKRADEEIIKCLERVNFCYIISP